MLVLDLHFRNHFLGFGASKRKFPLISTNIVTFSNSTCSSASAHSIILRWCKRNPLLTWSCNYHPLTQHHQWSAHIRSVRIKMEDLQTVRRWTHLWPNLRSNLSWESAELYPGPSCKPGSIQESTMSSLSKTIKTWLANLFPPPPTIEHPPITKDVTRV